MTTVRAAPKGRMYLALDWQANDAKASPTRKEGRAAWLLEWTVALDVEQSLIPYTLSTT